jgi:hypothetical protein
MAITLKKKIKENVNSGPLNKEKIISDLIDEAAIITKRMKIDETRLTEIKDELKKYKLPEGIKVTPTGSGVVVGARRSFDPPTPLALYTYIKEQRKGKMFFSCVKVIGAEAIVSIGKEAYESLRIRNADIPTFSFK